MQHIRLFIALEIPAEQARSLCSSFKGLPITHSLYRQSPAAQLHITLKFLGNTDIALLPKCIEALESACEQAQPVTTEYTQGEMRPYGRPRTVIMGVDKTETLAELYSTIETHLAEEGIAHYERRAFHAHITVARSTVAPSPADIQTIASWILDGSLTAGTVTLFESILKPTGALYNALHRISVGNI